jgi:hypothetical protein
MLFDAVKAADVKTVGDLAVAGGVALGVYEVFGSSRPSYLWPGLLVVGGIAAHVVVMDPKSITALGQGAAGASSGASGANVARDLGENAKREDEVKALPWVVGGAAVALVVLKILL